MFCCWINYWIDHKMIHIMLDWLKKRVCALKKLNVTFWHNFTVYCPLWVISEFTLTKMLLLMRRMDTCQRASCELADIHSMNCWCYLEILWWYKLKKRPRGYEYCNVNRGLLELWTKLTTVHLTTSNNLQKITSNAYCSSYCSIYI